VFKTNQNTRHLRSALLLGAASAAITVSAPASAQDQGNGNVETVVVTGSRIPQVGLYSAQPVTAVGQQELKFEGTTDVTTLINNLPAAFSDQNEGMSNGSSGTANVDLRGLGSKRTLVLVNGSRLMPADPQDPVADLNNIPASLVDHVEVLTGGGSAVYGSDALGGVVNFIMRKDFEGVEVDGEYEVSNNANDNSTFRGLEQSVGDQTAKEGIWNGASTDATLLLGTNTANDKGNVTAYLEYRNIQPVLEGTRDFSGCTLNPGPACGGSVNYKLFTSLDNEVVGGFSSTYFETGNGTRGNGQFVPFTSAASQHFNYGALNYLQRPDTRYTGGFFAHYEENKQLDIYSSFMFADDHSVGQIAPSGLFYGSGVEAPDGISGAVEANCGNPLMTPQENKILCGLLPGDTLTTTNGFTYYGGQANIVPGQASMFVGRRDVEGPPRFDDFRHTSYRMQIGARGDLGDGWSYDVYAQYGLTLTDQIQGGYFSEAKVQNALQVVPGTGTPACISGGGCVPLDIFNGIGAFSQAAIASVVENALQTGETDEQVVSGALTGNLGEWGIQSPWSKDPVGISVGAEYRSESLVLNIDQIETSGDLEGFGSAPPSVPRSGFNVSEGFTEVQVPLVEGLPWAEQILVKGGYRYSSYSTAGSTNTYYYSAEWQPIDDIRARASVQRAVRAPNVVELFSPPGTVLFNGQDPCSANGPAGSGDKAVIANCIKEGVPAQFVGSKSLNCIASQCNALTGGNILLKPETSDTRTAGLVFTPTFFDGFNATVDYFNIKVDKFIGTVNPVLTLTQCYGDGATGASQAFFCPFVHRNPVTHTISGGPGNYVQATNVNTGYLQTKGIDYELNYTSDMGMWGFQGMGSLAFNVVGTWLDTFTTEPLPGFPSYNCAGQFDCNNPTAAAVNPKWRQKLRVTWSTPWDVDLSAEWRYIGSVGFSGDSSNPLVGGGPGNFVCPNGKTVSGEQDCWDGHIGAYDYFDLSADWTVRQGIDLRAGVNNIADVDPPALLLNACPTGPCNGNTYPGTYDSLGRVVFVAATIKY